MDTFPDSAGSTHQRCPELRRAQPVVDCVGVTQKGSAFVRGETTHGCALEPLREFGIRITPRAGVPRRDTPVHGGCHERSGGGDDGDRTHPVVVTLEFPDQTTGGKVENPSTMILRSCQQRGDVRGNRGLHGRCGVPAKDRHVGFSGEIPSAYVGIIGGDQQLSTVGGETQVIDKRLATPDRKTEVSRLGLDNPDVASRCTCRNRHSIGRKCQGGGFTDTSRYFTDKSAGRRFPQAYLAVNVGGCNRLTARSKRELFGKHAIREPHRDQKASIARRPDRRGVFVGHGERPAVRGEGDPSGIPPLVHRKQTLLVAASIIRTPP